MCANRLRIGYLVHDYHRYGGHSRYVAELARRFCTEHEVHVFSNTFDEPNAAGIIHHHVPAWRANALTTILSFVLPVTWQARGNFDILHAQGFCGLRQNVVTAHICQAGWFAAVDRWIGRESWRKRVFRAVTTRLEKSVYRPSSARVFIAVSDRVRRDLNEHHHLSDAIRVIHHGVDCETFHPRNCDRWRSEVRKELGLQGSNFAVLYVGDWQKAGPPILKALTATADTHVVVVTRSSPAEIRQAAENAGVANRIILIPPTQSIERYYAAVDAFVFPSFYDTFGMVVAEAMATGLPVVVSDSAGAAEWVNPGENGLLLQNAWDDVALGQALATLRDDPDLRRKLGTAARHTADTHSWDRVAEETMATYRSVLSTTT